MDVMFLEDLPADMLTPQFCKMVKEYVSRFGGGLVVLAGPRFGPEPLESRGLAELLPVVAEPSVVRKEQTPFRLQLTPAVSQYGFMELGSDSPSDRPKEIHTEAEGGKVGLKSRQATPNIGSEVVTNLAPAWPTYSKSKICP